MNQVFRKQDSIEHEECWNEAEIDAIPNDWDEEEVDAIMDDDALDEDLKEVLVTAVEDYCYTRDYFEDILNDDKLDKKTKRHLIAAQSEGFTIDDFWNAIESYEKGNRTEQQCALGILESMRDTKDMDGYNIIGVFLDLPDQRGHTPIHHAIFDNYNKVIEFLAQDELCIHYKDKWGRTPLHLASLLGNRKAVKILFETRARECVYALDNEHRTPLHVAATVKIAKCLLEECLGSGSINATSKFGTPLHHAIADQRYAVALFLLVRCYADQTVKNVNGMTPLEMLKSQWKNIPEDITLKSALREILRIRRNGKKHVENSERRR